MSSSSAREAHDDLSLPTQRRRRPDPQRLDHPVIDADGHLIEFLPLVDELVREIADAGVAERYRQFMRHALAPDDGGFMPARVFWGLPEENTLDRTTVMLPAVRRAAGRARASTSPRCIRPPVCRPATMPDAEVRQALAGRSTRTTRSSSPTMPIGSTPVAVIPHASRPRRRSPSSTTPSGTLGMKARDRCGRCGRRGRTLPRRRPRAWLDSLGHDSAHDYDPVWAALRRAAASSLRSIGGMGWGSRISTDELHATTTSATSRPPARPSAGRCSWVAYRGASRPALRLPRGRRRLGAHLYNDIIGHWEKRNRDTVQHFDPRRLRSRPVRLAARRVRDGRIRDHRDATSAAAERLIAPPHETLGC